MDNNSLKRFLKAQKEWVRDFLFEILAIPSESGKEEKVLKALHGFLKRLGVDCDFVEIEDGLKSDPEYSDIIKDLDYTDRPNIRAVSKGDSNRIIILNSHVDVVPPSLNQVDPYIPFMDESGDIFARGACDAKGQIAVMALIMKTSKDFMRLKHNIVCHFVIEEELGGNGTLAMVKHEGNRKIDAAINLEPTDLKVMPSIRGAVWFNIGFSGESGHSGSRSNEINPIIS